MSLNLDALKDAEVSLDKGDFDEDFLYTSKMEEETDVRVLPPAPQMNGLPYSEIIQYWFGNKPYISPATFGRPCPIEDEVRKAEVKAEKDRDLRGLLDNEKGMARKKAYWIPLLLLETEWEEGECVDAEVTDTKILVCGPSLTKAIVKVLTSKQFQSKAEDGGLDRVKGFNMILSKTGQGKKTRYGAEGIRPSMEMPEEYYTNTPNPYELAERMMSSDEYLRCVVRNYLYGEELPEEDTWKKEAKDAAKEEEKTDSKKTARKASSSKKPSDKKQGRRSRSKARPEDEESAEDNDSDGGEGKDDDPSIVSALNNLE